MKYLLDTHAFMWSDSTPSLLSAEAAAVIRDPNSIIYLSMISIWEIQIKYQIGKLSLTMPLSKIIERQQHENEIELLPIRLSHILELGNLALHHRDPFDRLLIAQARIEDLTLISSDSRFGQYPVKVIW